MFYYPIINNEIVLFQACNTTPVEVPVSEHTEIKHDRVGKLSNAEVSRYSRQLILPQIAVTGKYIKFPAWRV